MKKFLIVFILSSSWIFGEDEKPLFVEGACWYFNSFYTNPSSDLNNLWVNKPAALVDGMSLFFNPPHPACFGHLLLDGVIPLYKVLDSYNLLMEPINLLVCLTDQEMNNPTVRNVFEFLRLFFENVKIVFLPMSSTKSFGFSKLLLDQTTPLNLPASDVLSAANKRPSSYLCSSFFRAFPGSYKYMKILRDFEFRENVAYRDDSAEDNLVKKFVRRVKTTYNLHLPTRKNRVIISLRPGREILNLKEIVLTLVRDGFEVRCIDFEKLPMKSQIEETQQAEFLIGTYGSNLVNAIFLNEGANVVVLWHKYAKYFWSRKYCIIHSAFLSAGIRLIEYDKPNYDSRDIYFAPFQVSDYFFTRDGRYFLREEKINMDSFVNFPLASANEFRDVHMYFNPEEISQILKQYKTTP